MTNHELIREAVLAEYRIHGSRNQEHILEGAMKRMDEPVLICYAQELGIDTDRILSAPRPA